MQRQGYFADRAHSRYVKHWWQHGAWLKADQRIHESFFFLMHPVIGMQSSPLYWNATSDIWNVLKALINPVFCVQQRYHSLSCFTDQSDDQHFTITSEKNMKETSYPDGACMKTPPERLQTKHYCHLTTHQCSCKRSSSAFWHLWLLKRDAQSSICKHVTVWVCERQRDEGCALIHTCMHTWVSADDMHTCKHTYLTNRIKHR